MDKINTQKFNLSVKKSDTSKTDEVLGALFSMPLIVDEKKISGKKITNLLSTLQLTKY